MNIVLPPALNQMVKQALDESPALEAALLEGIRSPVRPFDESVLEEIKRQAIAQA